MISAALALKEVTCALSVTNISPMQSATQMDQPVREQSDASPVRSMQRPPKNAPSSQFMPVKEIIPPSQVPDCTKLTPSLPPIQPKLSKPKSKVSSKEPSQVSLDQPSSETNANFHPPKEKQAKPQPSISDHMHSATTTKPPSSEEEHEAANSAVLFMVTSLFWHFFSTVWPLVEIAFRIGSKLCTFLVLVIARCILRLFLANDDGAAWEMGAGMEYEYNMPMIH